jgi:hypothetical protein
VIVAGVAVETGVVAIVNFAELAPAAIATVPGTEATPPVAERLTTSPPAGAAPVSVTVPEPVAPPAIDFGAVTELRPAGVRDNVRERDTPEADAVMMTVWLDATPFVLIIALVEVRPAATETEAGTVASEVSLLESETTRPPEGAAASSFTVPIADLPPTTVAVVTVKPESDPATTDDGIAEKTEAATKAKRSATERYRFMSAPSLSRTTGVMDAPGTHDLGVLNFCRE